MTYAIFKAAGFQYRAELGDILRLPSLNAESGETVTFDEVLLGAADDEVLVGRPILEGAAVRAQVLRHGRADKVIVFKFKRRKNYRRKSGHRQNYTEVRVSEIDLGGDLKVSLEVEKKPKAKPKAEPKAEAAAKPAAKKPAAKKPAAKKPAAEKAAPKKAAAKKPAAKKAAEKKAAAKPKAEAEKKKTTKAKEKAKSKKKS